MFFKEGGREGKDSRRRRMRRRERDASSPLCKGL